MKVRFLAKAADELEAIGDYIARDNPRAAKRLVSTIRRSLGRLAESGFPDMFPEGRRRGTREIVVGRYIAIYRHDQLSNEIVVLSVVHGARRR